MPEKDSEFCDSVAIGALCMEKNFQNATDMVYALTVRTLDMSVDLSYFSQKKSDFNKEAHGN